MGIVYQLEKEILSVVNIREALFWKTMSQEKIFCSVEGKSSQRNKEEHPYEPASSGTLKILFNLILSEREEIVND